MVAGIRPGGHPARDSRPERRALERGALKLSVVIPAYNEAGVVERTVRTVVETLGGAGVEHELLVVDDASTDGTTDILEALAGELDQVRWIRSPYSGGTASRSAPGSSASRGTPSRS